jgi:uncharacterized membrane protein
MNPGDLHTALLHFPIVLFWTALIYDLLGWIWKVRAYPAGHWIVVIATALVVPTVITGLMHSQDHQQTATLLAHRNWGLVTLTFSIPHAFFRLMLILKKMPIKGSLLVIFSVVNVAMVSLTADYGEKYTFGQGIFVGSDQKEHHHAHQANEKK